MPEKSKLSGIKSLIWAGGQTKPAGQNVDDVKAQGGVEKEKLKAAEAEAQAKLASQDKSPAAAASSGLPKPPPSAINAAADRQASGNSTDTVAQAPVLTLNRPATGSRTQSPRTSPSSEDLKRNGRVLQGKSYRKAIGKPSRVEIGTYFPPVALLQSEFNPDFEIDVPFRKLGVFVRNSVTGAPVPKIPLYVVAEVNAAIGTAPPPPEPLFRYALGTLGTDHAGFASFDLTVLFSSTFFAQARARLGPEFRGAQAEPVIRLSLKRLVVYPFQDKTTGFDALVAGDKGPDFIVLLLAFQDADLRTKDITKAMTSIQSPSLIDHRLSPSSFTLSNTLLIGEDGCETMLPAGLASQLYRFRQIAFTEHEFTSTTSPGSADATIPFPAWLGLAIDYEAEWTAIGHSLGDLAYSLPLAPGEKVKIAVIDWSRTDRAERTERSGFSERLDHSTLRDRGIDETVGMAMGEHQQGRSSVAGVAASGSGSIGPISFGASASYSTASTSSSGSRSLEAETVQNLADGFLQASSAVRELTSSVVVQGLQAEQSSAQTRTVANYNHSHALTILYYGVQRHYKVVIRPSARTPVLLVPPEYLDDFIEGDLTKWAWAIEQVLLDEKLRGCLDKARRLPCPEERMNATSSAEATREQPAANNPGEFQLGNINTEFRTTRVMRGQSRLTMALLGDDGNPISLEIDGRRGHTSAKATLNRTDFTGANSGTLVPAKDPVGSYKWNDIKTIRLRYEPSDDSPRSLHITKLRYYTRYGDKTWEIYSFESSSDPHVIVAGQAFDLVVPPYDEIEENAATEGSNSRSPPSSPQDLNGVIEDRVHQSSACCLQALLDHMNAHRTYYEAAIYSAAGQFPKGKELFERASFDSKRLDKFVSRRPAGVADGMLALPLRPNETDVDNQDSLLPEDLRQHLADEAYLYEYAEQLVTLPVRGVFAEAKLGHCNASELIDNTRFWKWHEAPIPDQAPDIAPIDTGSRYQTPMGIAPSAMPGSMLNIVNPPAAPDPTGLANATALMSAMGPFRDMSGVEAAGSLAAVLAEGSRSLAEKEAERRAREGEEKDEGNGEIGGSQFPPKKPGDIGSGGDSAGRGWPALTPQTPPTAETPTQPVPNPTPTTTPVPEPPQRPSPRLRPQPTPTPTPLPGQDPTPPTDPNAGRLYELELRWSSLEVRSTTAGFQVSIPFNIAWSTEDADVYLLGRVYVRGRYNDENGRPQYSDVYQYLLQGSGTGEEVEGFIHPRAPATTTIQLQTAALELPEGFENSQVRLYVNLDRDGAVGGSGTMHVNLITLAASKSIGVTYVGPSLIDFFEQPGARFDATATLSGGHRILMEGRRFEDLN